jgi:hypothetical protein
MPNTVFRSAASNATRIDHFPFANAVIAVRQASRIAIRHRKRWRSAFGF